MPSGVLVTTWPRGKSVTARSRIRVRMRSSFCIKPRMIRLLGSLAKAIVGVRKEGKKRNRRSPKTPAVPVAEYGTTALRGQWALAFLSLFFSAWHRATRPDWRPMGPPITICSVNEESLRRANAFLAKIAEQIQPGESLEASPADIGSQIGLPDPLAAARAVRALLARRRLEMVDGKYRLLDPKPVEPGEPEAIRRPPRRKRL